MTENVEKAVFVGIITNNDEESKVMEYLDELEFLAETAGATRDKKFVQRLDRPDNSTYIRSGKLQEIADYCEQNDIRYVIFDDELSGTQQRNIEKIIKTSSVIDRTSLILEIFAQRANYAEARNENLSAPDAKVYNAVNQIRQRVNLPGLKEGLSKDQMRDAIRLERRLELAFEGIHLFDTRSYRTTEKDVTKPVYGIDPDGKKILIETRKFNPNRDYLWAIPLKEIDLSQGALKQNPGWD